MHKKNQHSPAVLRAQIFNMKRRATDMLPGLARDELETDIAKKEEALRATEAVAQKK